MPGIKSLEFLDGFRFDQSVYVKAVIRQEKQARA
jgi:hypothetical protein